MSNISDLSGDEREQRIAQLKQKMQEAAAKSKAEQEAAASQADETEDAGAVVEVESAVVADNQAESGEADLEAEAKTETDVDVAPIAEDEAERADEADMTEEIVPEVEVEMAEEVAVPAAAAVAEPFAYMEDERSEEDKLRAQMNRREFLTYTWGAAMGLLLLGSGVATFQFMYPRFKAGEFGGAFLMGPESALPPMDAAPQPITNGKFWWINTEEEGPQALYMVCTHLGCLYKWVDENYRFECPCHGSKFTREGLYIEGPAPRSLDTFEIALIDGVWVVDTGAKINGAPASDSAAAGTG